MQIRIDAVLSPGAVKVGKEALDTYRSLLESSGFQDELDLLDEFEANIINNSTEEEETDGES